MRIEVTQEAIDLVKQCILDVENDLLSDIKHNKAQRYELLSQLDVLAKLGDKVNARTAKAAS